MEFRWISIALVFAIFLIQAHSGEPLRVGIDVPEPKLISKVEVPYPDFAKIGVLDGPVVVDILIDERGMVAEVNARFFNSAFLEPAISAVKQWRFSPTFVDGKAVQVTATVVVVFSNSSTPYTIDLGINKEWVPSYVGDICCIPAMLGHNGNLQEDLHNLPSLCNGRPDVCWIIPDADVPFSVIEERMKLPTPASFPHLQAPQYRFPWGSLKYARPGSNRLYYSVLLVSNGSQLVQLAGVDSKIQPPEFDIDFGQLAESLDVSRYPSGAVFFYTVFVDESGGILGIEDHDHRDKTSAIEDALRKAQLIAPGTRKGVPVPTAVILAIPVK